MRTCRTGIALAAAALAAALALSSCTAAVPMPVLSTLSPDHALSTAASFTLTVRGGNFQANSVILFNGLAKATTYVGPGELSCLIAAADMAVTASAAGGQSVPVPVYVSTPAAGYSAPQNFRIDIYPEFAAARMIAWATRAYYDTIRPQIAFAGGGRLGAAWRDQESLYFSASDDAGASWTSPALLHTAPVSSYRFSLTAGRSAGQLFLAWEESSLIYLIRSADGGRTWSPRAALTDASVSRAQNPGLFVDASGALFAVYLSQSPAWGAPYAVIILKSADGGATFSPLGTVSWNTYFTGDRGPRMAADAAGVLYLVFPSDFGTRYMTDELAFSTNGGVSWSTPANVNLVASALATDAMNGLLLAGSNMYLPYMYKLTFKRSDDRGATWSPQDFADTTFTFPALVVNAYGSTDLVWTGKFTRSFDRGATWNEVVSFTDDATADNPALAEDASGRIFIVWWSTTGAIFFSSSAR
jgi:hypothetical protein